MINKARQGRLVCETEVFSKMLLHEDTRNIHGKVFGGLLMRLGFEAMYISGKQLFKHRDSHLIPTFIDDVIFHRPV